MQMQNNYYLVRHGEALSNVKDFVSSWKEKKRNPLTEKGIEQIKKAGDFLKSKNISLIYSSDLLRTRQTAEIIGKALKIKPKFDKRLREYNVGVFNGRPVSELHKALSSQLERFHTAPKKGETYTQMEGRMKDFILSLEKKHKGENIVIVSHQVPIILLLGIFESIYFRV